jgi:hypothetical protein
MDGFKEYLKMSRFYSEYSRNSRFKLKEKKSLIFTIYREY